MSIRIMTRVWDTPDLPDSEKIVLLALADCANDEGHCWPGMKSLEKKCDKSDRTIQAAIKSLVEKGHLTRREVVGKGCNYTVHPRSVFTPEETSPPKGTTQTPEAASGKPSLTVITSGAKAPSVARKREKKIEHPLPEDFEMPQDWLEMAMQLKQWNKREAKLEAERFKAHAQMNDRMCKDWKAAWRNWILNDLCKTIGVKAQATAYRNMPRWLP